MGRRTDSGVGVGGQCQVEHFLLDYVDEGGLPGLHPGQLAGVGGSSVVRFSENWAYRYSRMRPCSISQASPSR